MPQIDSSLVDSLANLDSLRLVILFIGLISLGVIGLACAIVKRFGRRK
jgi:hypothetical protein